MRVRDSPLHREFSPARNRLRQMSTRRRFAACRCPDLRSLYSAQIMAQMLLHLAADHRTVHDPRSQQPQIQEWQHKHRQLLGCAARYSAGLAPGCRLLPNLECPRSQQPQTQEWQQKPAQLLGCVGRSLAALALGCRPRPGCPQATTAPDSRMAAKPKLVAWTCCTLLSWSCTWLLSPP